MNNDYHIEFLDINDYEKLLLFWKSIKGLGIGLGDSKENIKKFIAKNPNSNFQIKKNGEVIGTILCGNDGRRGYIYHLAIHKNFRKQSLGSRLVNTVLNNLKKEGITKCHVMIFNENRDGLEFWKKVNFDERHDVQIMSKII